MNLRFLVKLCSVLVLFTLVNACNGTPNNTQKELFLGVATFSLGEINAQGSLQAQAALPDTAIRIGTPTFLDFVDTSTNTRYLKATFPITNQTNTAFQNLTLYALNQSGISVGGTALEKLENFVGGASSTNAQALLPIHATLSGGSLDTNNSDFQAFTGAEAAALQKAALTLGSIRKADKVLPYGFVARNGAHSRVIGAGQTGSVTLAYRISNNQVNAAYKFVARFVVSNEPITRVTRGANETTVSADARATNLGASELMLIGADSDVSAASNRSTLRVANVLTSLVPVCLLQQINSPRCVGYAFSTGTYHSLGLLSGQPMAWGSNRAGEMGIGRNDPDNIALPVPIALSGDIVALSAGGYQSLVLTRGGKVWSFGANEAGQRGDNTQVSDSNGNGTPVMLSLSNITAISSGAHHNLALDSNGVVYAWGANENGQVGQGGSTDTRFCGEVVNSTPTNYQVKVPTVVSFTGQVKMKQIVAGYCSSYALDETGAVWSWGFGDYQAALLGRGNLDPVVASSTPAKISGLSNIVGISAGVGCAYALNAAGEVYGWGVNREGCVGNGTQSTQPSPVKLTLTNVRQIAARAQGAYALKNDGSVWSWGESMYGSVGNGTFVNKVKLVSNDRVYVTSPVRIQTWNDVVSIHSGNASNHVFVVRIDGSIWTWGRNKSGNLGNGEIGDSDSTNNTPDDKNIATPIRVDLQ